MKKRTVELSGGLKFVCGGVCGVRVWRVPSIYPTVEAASCFQAAGPRHLQRQQSTKRSKPVRRLRASPLFWRPWASIRTSPKSISTHSSASTPPPRSNQAESELVDIASGPSAAMPDPTAASPPSSSSSASYAAARSRRVAPLLLAVVVIALALSPAHAFLAPVPSSSSSSSLRRSVGLPNFNWVGCPRIQVK